MELDTGLVGGDEVSPGHGLAARLVEDGAVRDAARPRQRGRGHAHGEVITQSQCLDLKMMI